MFRNVTVNKRRLDFEINNADVAIVNCLRRIILAEFPTVAIGFDPYVESANDIKFESNTSALHNEFLGHRISLIPVHIRPEDFEVGKYTFSINVINKSSLGRWVTSKDIMMIDGDGARTQAQNIFPPDEKTKDFLIITKLKANETLNVTFKARVGISKLHSRWSPVSLCTFSNKLDLARIAAAIVDKPSLANDNKFQTLDKYRMFMTNTLGEPNMFNFTIESECSISPIEIFTKAYDIIIGKLSNISSTYEELNSLTHLYAVNIDDQDHTIGNLLQAIGVNEYIRKPSKYKLTYIGYYQPHPLESNIIMKIAFGESKTDIDKFMNALSASVISILEDMKREWIAEIVTYYKYADSS